MERGQLGGQLGCSELLWSCGHGLKSASFRCRAEGTALNYTHCFLVATLPESKKKKKNQHYSSTLSFKVSNKTVVWTCGNFKYVIFI